MAAFAYYLYGRNRSGDLEQIVKHCGSLNSAKQSIGDEATVERYEEADGDIFAIVGGVRAYRIKSVELT